MSLPARESTGAQAGRAAALERALALHRARALPQALELYQQLLRVQPDCADVLHLAGLAAHQLGDSRAGVHRVERAIELRPRVAAYHRNLALMCLELGRPTRASRALERSFALAREGAEEDAPDRSRTTLHKLEHDAEQLRYLAARRPERAELADLAARYRTLHARLAAEVEPGALVPLGPRAHAHLSDSYNQPLHVAAAPEVAGGALHADLDGERVARVYARAEPRAVVLDSLLVPEALAALRRFCLESMLWFDFRHPGYLGARLEHGFCCPLLLQIAAELRHRLPAVLGPHPLREIWAFVYAPGTQGIGPHADVSAVNVNLWITPDEANLDPERGGLVIHDAQPPRDWDFDAFNRDPERIRRQLRASASGRREIAHRQNRAVIFDAQQFHETDAVPFRPGYAQRRINVTFLFG